MAVHFGAFVLQERRLDLVDIDDSIAPSKVMAEVVESVDRDQASDSDWAYDKFHTVPPSSGSHGRRFHDSHEPDRTASSYVHFRRRAIP